ncbi:hypothetical protein ABC347_10840 [Sphingomonas sp. 1P06PA]|uniref:hypothetical protein n=1 Tax=Sphingomonas sp. 1P06PA TaxID=554121 RepID=UPI0039A56FBA
MPDANPNSPPPRVPPAPNSMATAFASAPSARPADCGWLLGALAPTQTPMHLNVVAFQATIDRVCEVSDKQDQLANADTVPDHLTRAGGEIALADAYEHVSRLEYAQMITISMTPLQGREDMVSLVAHLAVLAENVPTKDPQFPMADAALRGLHAGIDTLAAYLLANGADQMQLPSIALEMLQKCEARDALING